MVHWFTDYTRLSASPPTLTALLADEKELQIDWESYKKAKAAHEKASAGALGLKGTSDLYKQLRQEHGATPLLETLT